MSLVITVRGEHESWHQAERGIVYLSVELDGPDRDEVFMTAVQSSRAVQTLIAPLASNDGAVSRWSSDTVRITSQRPWSNTGEQLPLVHSAAVEFVVRFREFDALALFVEQISAVEFSKVSRIEWELTDHTERAATSQARGLAVTDAVTKAREYATSVGLSDVTATAIADSGMLDGVGPAGQGGPMVSSANMRLMSSGTPDQLALKPALLSVFAGVEARFSAS